MHTRKIVTAEQMRTIEDRSEAAGVSKVTLMDNAGLAVARRVKDILNGPGGGGVEGASIVVLVGPGNNGGDGLVAAWHLHNLGAQVSVCLCLDNPKHEPKIQAIRDQGAPLHHAEHTSGLARIRQALDGATIVIDAILGASPKPRPIDGPIADVLGELAEAKEQRPDIGVVALDLPTGLHADTGAVAPACVAADVTLTLGNPKTGLYRFPGADFTGEVEVLDIGLPPNLDDDVDLELMTGDWARRLLPARPRSGHKGSFGKVLMVVGSRNYVGAASLAAAAAGRAGAGLVTLAIPHSLQAVVASSVLEPTYLPLPEDSPGIPSAEGADLIVRQARDYDAVLIGCGMGQEYGATELIKRLLMWEERLPPLILDADALNYLSRFQHPGWWNDFTMRAVLTPHPGEMARLAGGAIGDIERDRVKAARHFANRWGKVVVLKGAYTVVAAPNGPTLLSPFANPALATAGTGDVLSGIIAALLAQKLPLHDAAALGVYIHALAGKRVSATLGDSGLLAGDLLLEIPRAVRGLRVEGRGWNGDSLLSPYPEGADWGRYR